MIMPPAKDKDHVEPCNYTRATRWLVVILLALILSGLGWIAGEKSALQQDQKHTSEIQQAQAVKQGVLETEMKIRLDAIDNRLREIQTKLEKGN